MQVPVLPLVVAIFAIPVAARAAAPQMLSQAEQSSTAPAAIVTPSLERVYKRAEHQNPELQRALFPLVAAEGAAMDARGLQGAVIARGRVVRSTLSVPLLLFRSMGSVTCRARAELEQAQIRRRSANRAAISDIHTLWQTLQSRAACVHVVRDRTLPALGGDDHLADQLSQFIVLGGFGAGCVFSAMFTARYGLPATWQHAASRKVHHDDRLS